MKYKDLKKVSGWLGYPDYEIIKILANDRQKNSSFGIVEIGVHLGKSLIPLAIFSGQKKLYVIDIFDDQSQNIDKSGNGSLAKFKDNLKKFNIDSSRITIDARMSSEVNPADILDQVGLVDIFHIDGGHHRDAVENDITLACEVTTEECIIIIDDMFRAEWPEVSIATFSHQRFQESEFELFAVGFNKGFWCKSHKLEYYRDLLKHNSRLSPFLVKNYSVMDRELLVYQRYPLPEWGIVKLIIWYLATYQPIIFPKVNRLVSYFRALKQKI